MAKLKGRSTKLLPPTIALTLPVRFSIATSAAVGPPGPPRRFEIGPPRTGLELAVERRADGQAALEDAPGPVAVDELLGHPGGEVGHLRVGARWVDVVLGGDRLEDGRVVLDPGDHPLVQHPAQDEVATALGRQGILDGVVGRAARR